MRHLLTILGALLLSACGAPDASDEQAWPDPSPALWEVTAPNGEQGWLFGTMHSLPDGVAWRTEALDSAFAEAGVLVVEIAELGDSQLAFDMFRKRAYSPGLPPLYERVEADERAMVEALVEKARADPADYGDMESWAVAMVLAGGVRIGDPENGADRVLMAAGKPLVGLESFAAQYDIFDRLSPSGQADLLVAMARDAEANSPAVLTAAWVAGDVDRYLEHVNRGLADFPQVRDALMVDRNARWADRIAALVESGRKPFVAVGAAHVPGEDGLLALLAARGYSVRRIQ